MSTARHDPAGRDWAELKPLHDSGITLLNAHFTEHRFEVHSLETYAVGLTLGGPDSWLPWHSACESAGRCDAIQSR